jgi:PAS domain S-box-containing protein
LLKGSIHKLLNIWLIPLVVLLAGILLAWSGFQRDQAQMQRETLLLQSTLENVASDIAIHIEDKRDILKAFVQLRQNLLQKLYGNPDDLSLQETLLQELRYFFPQLHAATITDARGDPLLTDYDGNISQVCLRDIRSYLAAGRPDFNSLYVHPQALGYHVDLMVPLPPVIADGGIAFISLYPTFITERLRLKQNNQFRLIVLNTDKPGLIEFTAQGGRDEIHRDFFLSAEERNSIIDRRQIIGSHWELAALPVSINAAAFAPWQKSIVTVVLLLVAGIVAAILLWRYNSQIRQQHLLLEDQSQQLQRSYGLLSAINLAQSTYIADETTSANKLFASILDSIMQLTGSECGFIGEIMHQDDGMPYLQPQAVADITWRDTAQKFCVEDAPADLEISGADTLFGSTLHTGETILCNDVTSSPHGSGLPAGHPPVYSLASMVMYAGKEFVGMMGLVNRPGGYDQQLIDELAPVLNTCANLIAAYRANRQAIQTARELADSQATMATILDTVVDGILSIDDRGVIQTFNRAAELIFGYQAEEVIGRNVDILMPDPAHSLYDKQQQCCREICGEREFIGRRKDGSLFPMDVAVNEMWLDGKRQFTSILRDITERRQIEQAVKENERRFRSLVENIPGVTYRCQLDADWTMQYISDDIADITGYPASDFINNNVRSFASVMHPDDRDHVEQAVQDALRAEQPWVIEYRVIDRNNDVHWLYEKGQAIRDSRGDIVYLDGFILDNTERKETELQLSQFKSTLDQTLDCVFMFHPENLKFFYVNRGAMDQVGYSREELLQMTPFDLKPEFNEQQFREFIAPMLRQEKDTASFETIHRHKNGKNIPVEIFLQYIAPVGEEARFVAIVRDITERKQAEQHLLKLNNQMQAVLASTNYSVIATTPDGVITLFNDGAERLLGYTAAEVLGRQTPAIFHDADEITERAQQLSAELSETIAPGFEAFVARARRMTGYADENEWTYIRKDGSRFPVQLSVTALRDEHGEVTGFLGVASDITERKKVDRLKDEFISTVSHELRTPLTSIHGSLGLLNGGVAGKLPEQASNLVDIAHKNTERLLLLINDILDISRIESGKMNYSYQPVSIHEFLQEAIRENLTYATDKGVSMHLLDCVETEVCADPGRLMQVMNNLLSNAIKFSPVNSSIEIKASRGNGMIRFSVTDHGDGIAPEFHSRIFEKFSQADASDARLLGGSGLGLHISKSIIEQLGGQIDFDSSPRGTTFYFLLREWEHADNVAATTTASTTTQDTAPADEPGAASARKPSH